MLTAARSAEVRLATWEEMDVAGRVWTIAADRMKAKREHRVPLCGRAVEILEAARELAGNSPLVFPMRSGRPIAASTLPKMLKYLEVSAVPHGFRSSFRDWAAEKTDHPREVIEAGVGPRRAEQGRGGVRSLDLFERRRLLMDDWESTSANQRTTRRGGDTMPRRRTHPVGAGVTPHRARLLHITRAASR